MKTGQNVNQEPPVAVVSGGSGAIGSVVVSNLLKHRFRVISLSRGQASSNLSRREFWNRMHIPYSVDVRSEQQVSEFATDLASHVHRVNLLVNCVGIREEPYGTRPSQQADYLWKDTFETNLFGLVRLTNAMIPLIVGSQDARIVNVSSLLGSISTHMNGDSYTHNDFFKSLPAYSASKSALNSYTMHIKYELSDENVCVQAVHPGYTRSPLNDGAGDLEPEVAGQFVTDVALGLYPSGSFVSAEGELPW